jgi:hypothetical protein
MRTRRHGWWLGMQGMEPSRVPHLAIRHNAPGLNNRLQATPNSLRSCLAPAIGRA